MFIPNLIPARERIDFDEARTLQRLGALFRMERRSRPRYFDGRFLAARDLIRDQGYFLARQADLGRAIGSGIVSGLNVSASAGAATELTVSPGYGLTAAGEMVALTTPLRVRLADLPAAQRLDAAFGIRRIPNLAPRNRSGVYVLALRPVEYSANPIAAYPTQIEGPRTVEDGDIVEGAVATLIPYPIEGDVRNMDAARAAIEREIFVLAERKNIPVSALPLAMVGLTGDAVTWLDPYLVRREAGLEHRDVLGMGFAPRALREAHLLQYQKRLTELDVPGRQSLVAANYFDVLPPGGGLPKSAIGSRDFSQNYFPPEVDVELSVIAEDELPALIEESLLLPPIDLKLPDEQLDSLAVLALIPVPRSSVRALQTELGQLTRTLRTTAPNLIAKRLPLEVLRGIRLPRVVLPPVDSSNVVDAAWRRVLNAADNLWYVRRRNLAYKVEVTGTAVALSSTEADNERVAITRLGRPAFDDLRARSTAAGTVELINLVSSPTFERMPELLPTISRALSEERTLDRAAVLKAGESFRQPGFGEGLARLKSTQPELVDRTVLDGLSTPKDLAGLDRLGATLSEDKLAALDKNTIRTLADSGELAKLDRPGARLTAERLNAIGRTEVVDATAPVPRAVGKTKTPKTRPATKKGKTK